MTREELLGENVPTVPTFKVAEVEVNEYELRAIQARVANGLLDPGLLVEDSRGNYHAILPDGSFFNEDYLPVFGYDLMTEMNDARTRANYQRMYKLQGQ